MDKHGPHLFSIMPHGSSSKDMYAALGSGSLAAMSVLETSWKPDLEVICYHLKNKPEANF